MKIFDDFIPKQYQLDLHNVIMGTSFNWNYQDNTIDTYCNPRSMHNPEYSDTSYFHHVFFKEDKTQISPYFGLVKPLLMFFEHRTGYKIVHTLRVVANLLMPTASHIIGVPHIDADSNTSDLKTILYYINDIDGPTSIYNEEFAGKPPELVTLDTKVDPKMGRCVTFDSERYHSSCTPTLGRRMVINAIVEVK